ncbi:trypsin-like serine peptidase [Amycolatopsis sp. lyj-23]|uniref:trypsin-like serine peptidase n=1 Tax=Amycolatopsis sp. lyj-23 TaxID=2789283 RepID=UPI00397E82FA
MQTRTRNTVVAGLASMALIGQLSPAASAAVADDVVNSAIVGGQQQGAALQYWTPERLDAAKEADVPIVAQHSNQINSPARRQADPYRQPPAFPAAGQSSSTRVALRSTSPQRWTSGGLIATTGGKVFFHNPKTNGDYACSGDAVNSDNKSVVATAGHCVVDPDGTAYQNWVFIPGYDHGNRPHGTFAATSLHWESQRIGDSDAAWDAAFVTVGPVNGARLVEAVGGQGIGFDLAPGQYVHSFGYGGSAAEGSGQQINWCAGTDTFASGHEGGGVWGIDCVQSGGSSGGAFLQGVDTGNGSGTQIGNISISVGNDEYHPYYGWEARAAYDAAQRS